MSYINIEGNKILPIAMLCDKKVITRNDKAQIEFDVELLKHEFVELYEDFMNNSQEFIDRLGIEIKSFGKNIKFKNIVLFNDISNIRKENIGKIVKLTGMISKITKVIALVKRAEWECNKCTNVITREDNKKPNSCLCNSHRGFTLIKEELQDIQEIELEELQDNIEGRQPQKIRVRLLDNLCNNDFSGIMQPGNKIDVIGIIKKIPVINKKENEELYEYKVIALDIIPLDERFIEESLSDEDLKQIYEIAADNPLDKLAQNLAPSIYGNDEIKKALVLQMVGGVKSKRKDQTYGRDRIHILLCGDPSAGKSKIAKNLQLRMPKSYYVSGDSSTKAGLIAIVDRDPLLNQWGLKAGALSKANDSILIIDEMDKLSDEDREGLHTPMELGEIVVDKADIHTTLKANCSILGLANPKNGMFDTEGPIARQINLPPPLLTRFDLIFIMKDKIDEKTDDAIINIICGDENNEDTLSLDIFRKYILHARKLKPTGLNETILKDKLKDFYKNIRRKSSDEQSGLKGMPITPRHAEGIKRLAEASAKIHLRETITEDDLKFSLDLFVNSLIRLGLDTEHGVVDMARVGFGKTINKKEKSRKILEIMGRLFEEGHKFVKDDVLKEKCREQGIGKYEADELIHELNKEGYLILSNEGWKIT